MLSFAGAGFGFFIILILLIFGGISGSADAPANVANYYTQGEGLKEYKEIYLKATKEVKDEKSYDVGVYQLAWYYALTEQTPVYEDVKKEAEWIADNKGTAETIADRFLKSDKYKDKLLGYSKQDIVAFIKDFKKMDEEIAKVLEEEDGLESEAPIGNIGANEVGADLNSKWYTSPTNPSSISGYQGQCTWYCWGRANEVFNGKYTGMPAGNARDWVWQWNQDWGQAPAVNSIAVWGGDLQHVAYVESYDGTTIIISEGNYNPTKSCVNYACSLEDSISFTNVWSGTLEELKTRQGGGNFIGFIYLK